MTVPKTPRNRQKKLQTPGAEDGAELTTRKTHKREQKEPPRIPGAEENQTPVTLAHKIAEELDAAGEVRYQDIPKTQVQGRKEMLTGHRMGSLVLTEKGWAEYDMLDEEEQQRLHQLIVDAQNDAEE